MLPTAPCLLLRSRLLLLLISSLIAPAVAAKPEYQVINDRLESPWGIALLGEGFLITEKKGQLLHLDQQGQLISRIGGVPDVVHRGQGGLLDIALDPAFEQNSLIYLTYVKPAPGGQTVALHKARLDGDRLLDGKDIFKAQPALNSRKHFGSRITIVNQHLFLTLGERGDRSQAQNVGSHWGSVIRLTLDGKIPDDNPAISGALPGIYSWGHRNPQGMVWDPDLNRLLLHEHGPQGGDEVNHVQAGKNYGWPVITYGKNYGTGTDIGEGTEKAGMEQPLHYWVPSIAPSGLALYRGDHFPQWKNHLLVGALKSKQLVLLKLEENQLSKQQTLFSNELGRIRDIEVDSGGVIYLVTDASPGKLVRVYNPDYQP